MNTDNYTAALAAPSSPEEMQRLVELRLRENSLARGRADVTNDVTARAAELAPDNSHLLWATGDDWLRNAVCYLESQHDLLGDVAVVRLGRRPSTQDSGRCDRCCFHPQLSLHSEVTDLAIFRVARGRLVFEFAYCDECFDLLVATQGTVEMV